MQDPWEQQVPGLGLGRDPVRTPIRWDDTLHAGFSTTTPWLPLGTDTPSAAAQAADPTSMLTLHRQLLDLRRREPALTIGDHRTVSADDAVYVYERHHERRHLVVALNLASEDQPLHRTGQVLITTHLVRRGRTR